MRPRLSVVITPSLIDCSVASARERSCSGAVEPRRGTIRGSVDVRREMPAANDRPAVGTVGMAPHHPAPDRRRSVVYLETAPQGAFEDADLPRPVLDQRNQTFVPWVLAVPVGATVEFPSFVVRATSRPAAAESSGV